MTITAKKKRSCGLNEAYREAARQICADTFNEIDLRVNAHGAVQVFPDGAFVECCMFVPSKKIDSPNVDAQPTDTE